MTRTPVFACSLIALSLAGLGTAQAQMYRWVDENGVTVYSQIPPPAQDAIEIRPHVGPTEAQVQDAQQRLRQRAEEQFDAEEDAKQAAAERAQAAEKRRRYEKECAIARERLSKYQNLGSRMVRTPEGETMRLTQDQVQTQIANARADIEHFCR